MRSAVTAIASCLHCGCDDMPRSPSDSSPLDARPAQLCRPEPQAQGRSRRRRYCCLNVFAGELLRICELDAFRDDLGNIHSAHQRVLRQARCLVVTGSASRTASDRGRIEHEHAHSPFIKRRQTMLLAPGVCFFRFAAASARRSAISSSTTLTPGLLNCWATAWTRVQRHLWRDDTELSVDDLCSHGIAGLHQHGCAHLGRNYDTARLADLQLCTSDATQGQPIGFSNRCGSSGEAFVDSACEASSLSNLTQGCHIRTINGNFERM